MFAFAANHNVQLQTPEKRKELGKLVAAAYHSKKDKEPLKRFPFIEEGKKIMVLRYPESFRDEMDAIISQFNKDNPPPERVFKKIRQRIPVRPRKVLLPLSAKK